LLFAPLLLLFVAGVAIVGQLRTRLGGLGRLLLSGGRRRRTAPARGRGRGRSSRRSGGSDGAGGAKGRGGNGGPADRDIADADDGAADRPPRVDGGGPLGENRRVDVLQR